MKRLKLGPLAPTLPERLALARAQQLDYAAFLTLLLADEVQRRDHLSLERRLAQAGFEDYVTLEEFDWSVPVQVDRRKLQTVFTLGFLAQAVGVAAVRAGHSVLFTAPIVSSRISPSPAWTTPSSGPSAAISRRTC
jgi:DNA replication protein DnaC